MGIHRRQPRASSRRGISAALYLLFICAAFALNARLGAFLLAVAIHEAGHLIAAYVLGANVSEFSLGLLGLRIKYSDFGLGCIRSCVICGAGSAVGLLFSVAVIVSPLSLYDTAMYFALLSASLGVVNLLPIRTLDGGSMLYIILENHLMPHRAKAVFDAVSMTVSAAFFVMCLYICFTRTTDISLLVISCYFIFASAFRS